MTDDHEITGEVGGGAPAAPMAPADRWWILALLGLMVTGLLALLLGGVR